MGGFYYLCTMFKVNDIKKWLHIVGYNVTFVQKPKHVLMKYINIRNKKKGHYFFNYETPSDIDEDCLYFEFFIKLLGNTSGWAHYEKHFDLYKTFPFLKSHYDEKIFNFLWVKRNHFFQSWLTICYNIDVHSKVGGNWNPIKFIDWFEKKTGLKYKQFSPLSNDEYDNCYENWKCSFV